MVTYGDIFFMVTFVPPLFKMLTPFEKLYFNTGNYTVTPKKLPATKTCYQVFYGTLVKYLKLIYFI